MEGRPAAWRTLTAVVTLSAQLVGMLGPPAVFAQSTQATLLERAQAAYEQSRFDDAIALLKSPVERLQLSGEELQKARALLARSYVKKGQPALAIEQFKAILGANESWRPDPDLVPPEEIEVFDQALKEFEAVRPPVVPPAQPQTPLAPPAKPKSKSKKTWYYVAGGVALAGIIAAVAGGGGGDKPPPPDPSLANFPPPPP